MTDAQLEKLERNLWQTLHNMQSAFSAVDASKFRGRFADITLRDFEDFEEYVYAFDAYLVVVINRDLEPCYTKARINAITRRWKEASGRLAGWDFLNADLFAAAARFEEEY